MNEKPSEKHAREIAEITEALAGSNTLQHLAQDLGFPWHSAINASATAIIAKHIAPLIHSAHERGKRPFKAEPK